MLATRTCALGRAAAIVGAARDLRQRRHAFDHAPAARCRLVGQHPVADRQRIVGQRLRDRRRHDREALLRGRRARTARRAGFRSRASAIRRHRRAARSVVATWPPSARCRSASPRKRNCSLLCSRGVHGVRAAHAHAAPGRRAARANVEQAQPRQRAAADQQVLGDRPARMRGWLAWLTRAVLSRQARTSDRTTHHEGPTTNGNRCLCHVSPPEVVEASPLEDQRAASVPRARALRQASDRVCAMVPRCPL